MSGVNNENKMSKDRQLDSNNLSPPGETDSIPATNDPDKKHIRTAGEKVFDEITYRGVDWLLNTAVAVTTSFVATRTKLGIKYFSNPVTNFFKRRLSVFTKNEKKLNEMASGGTLFTSIVLGGFAIIPVIMGMEANKKEIVKSLDRTIYGKDKVESDPLFEQSYLEIEREPKQDFMTGMYARFMALAPILAGMMVFDGFLKRRLYEPVAKCSKWIAEKLRIAPQSMKDKVMVAADGTKSTDWDALHQSLSADITLTLVYSYLHEHIYKRLADKLNRKEGDELNLRHETDIEDVKQTTHNSAPAKTTERTKQHNATLPTTNIEAQDLQYHARAEEMQHSNTLSAT